MPRLLDRHLRSSLYIADLGVGEPGAAHGEQLAVGFVEVLERSLERQSTFQLCCRVRVHIFERHDPGPPCRPSVIDHLVARDAEYPGPLGAGVPPKPRPTVPAPPQHPTPTPLRPPVLP